MSFGPMQIYAGVFTRGAALVEEVDIGLLSILVIEGRAAYVSSHSDAEWQSSAKGMLRGAEFAECASLAAHESSV